MKTEIIPQESNRREAFSMWMSSPMPMVTLVKTLDVSSLVEVSKNTGIKFTSLMCWCIGKAASKVEEFYILPEGGKLFRYDQLAINVIVENCKKGINSCDIKPCHSVEFPSPVSRPNYSVLDKTKFKNIFGINIPYWTDSLAVCLSNLNN